MYFKGRFPVNQFIGRAYLCQGQLHTPLSTDNLVRNDEGCIILSYILRVFILGFYVLLLVQNFQSFKTYKGQSSELWEKSNRSTLTCLGVNKAIRWIELIYQICSGKNMNTWKVFQKVNNFKVNFFTIKSLWYFQTKFSCKQKNSCKMFHSKIH